MAKIGEHKRQKLIDDLEKTDDIDFKSGKLEVNVFINSSMEVEYSISDGEDLEDGGCLEFDTYAGAIDAVISELEDFSKLQKVIKQRFEMRTEIDKLTDDEKNLFNIMVNEYGVVVSAAVAEEILKESRSTLYRKRKNGGGPNFIQDADGSNIKYPLHEIVRYICNTSTGYAERKKK